MSDESQELSPRNILEKLLPLADQVIGNPVNPNAANMLLKAGAQFFIEQTDKPPVRQ